ncbi:MAG: hypothetical protein QXU26_02635 [Thermofilaceae archaeon]
MLRRLVGLSLLVVTPALVAGILIYALAGTLHSVLKCNGNATCIAESFLNASFSLAVACSVLCLVFAVSVVLLGVRHGVYEGGI